MPKLDLTKVTTQHGSTLPCPEAVALAGRGQQALGDAGGLTQFGVNLVTLAPGAMSSLRHWHEQQDEFVMVLDGRLVLVEDDGPVQMRPGDFAAFPAGTPNGHHLINIGEIPAKLIAFGTRTVDETGHYSDVDLKVCFAGGEPIFLHRDGSPLKDNN